MLPVRLMPVAACVRVHLYLVCVVPALLGMLCSAVYLMQPAQSGKPALIDEEHSASVGRFSWHAAVPGAAVDGSAAAAMCLLLLL